MDKILIVDDNPHDRELLTNILLSSSEKYDICQAVSGKSALETVDQDPPDIILLDIQMTDTNGFEFLKKFNNRKDRFIPVLLVSAFTGENDRLEGLKLGATDFINKPFIPEEIIARIAVQIKLKKVHEKSKWITEKTNEGIKLLYKELEKQSQELKKLDSLKSDFISTVSHELRTPLAIIRQGVSLLHRKILGEVNDKQSEVLVDVIESVDRLVNIINDILDISKLEAGKVKLNKAEVVVSEFMVKLIKQFQIKAQLKDITLTTDFPEDLPSLLGDKDKLIQVVTNLIANAIKFTSQGGKIIVSAKATGDFVQLAISDTGVGISKEDVVKLFDKFQQFGRKDGPGEKGTGLGLAISKQIVELHEGTIWAESEIGKGSTFYIAIPKYEASATLCVRKVNQQLKEFQQSKQDENFSVILIRFENFEQIKMLMGQEACDKALANIAEKARKYATRPGDIVALYDFKKITMLLPTTDKKGAAIICGKIREDLQVNPMTYADKQLDVKILFGIASYPHEGKDANELISAAEKVFTKKKKLLIVDDHPQIIRLLTHRLEAENRFDCIAANNGQEAIAKALEHLPDLIICDVVMPEMNGYELIGHLKENSKTRDIPIIVLTAHKTETQEAQSLVPGSLPVITKTEGFEVIIEAINKLI